MVKKFENWISSVYDIKYIHLISKVDCGQNKPVGMISTHDLEVWKRELFVLWGSSLRMRLRRKRSKTEDMSPSSNLFHSEILKACLGRVSTYSHEGRREDGDYMLLPICS